jgi:hypothetical protein
MMWETSTVPWTHGVDITHIGLEIEELAGLFHIHPIPRLVLIQPFLLESGFRHTQMFGDPPEIFPGIRGRHRFTTVRAVETIRTLPDFFIRFDDKEMKPLERMSFQPAKETPHPAFVTLYDLSETA